MYQELIGFLRKHLRPVEDATKYGTWDYLGQFGNSLGGLLYAELFCPQFIEVEGSVLLDQGVADTPKRFSDAKREGTMSLKELESSFNILEAWYIFSSRTPTGSDDQSDDQEASNLLGQFIADAWRGRLALLYPSRRFEVVIIPEEETGDVPMIQFFEVR